MYCWHSDVAIGQTAMCDQGSKIKFCSCDPGTLDLPFPYWVLYREVGKSRLEIVGIFLPPDEPSALDQITIQGISDALNAGDSFDFEYTPEENDAFVLHIQKEQQFFFTCDKDFRVESDSLVWRYDYDPMHFGSDFEQINAGKLVAQN